MKIKISILVLLSLLFISLGFAQTTLSRSFQYGGIQRTYRIYIPAVYNPTVPVPLLFNLHGYGSNNIEQEFYGDFRPIADTADFIIVHPNGTLDNTNNRFWNTFGNSDVDDIGFLSALIDTLSAGYSIDQNRVYSTGMSNGGFMSYELACGLSNRIAAIASVAGSMIFEHLGLCNTLHPIPVMEIHGTADAIVPYNGTADFVPIDTLVDYWANFNNCSLTPIYIQVPDINLTDGCTAEHYVYDGGDLGTRVELFKIIGGGHTWPGAPITIGVTNKDFSASKEIWSFLSQYNLNGLITTNTDEGIAQVTALNIYPNPSPDKFNLDFTDFSEKTITISTYSGQIVKRYTSYSNKEVLNIEGKGVYFVTVTTGNQILTIKAVKY